MIERLEKTPFQPTICNIGDCKSEFLGLSETATTLLYDCDQILSFFLSLFFSSHINKHFVFT